jgi:hypothetical protein
MGNGSKIKDLLGRGYTFSLAKQSSIFFLFD